MRAPQSESNRQHLDILQSNIVKLVLATNAVLMTTQLKYKEVLYLLKSWLTLFF